MNNKLTKTYNKLNIKISITISFVLINISLVGQNYKHYTSLVNFGKSAVHGGCTTSSFPIPHPGDITIKDFNNNILYYKVLSFGVQTGNVENFEFNKQPKQAFVSLGKCETLIPNGGGIQLTTYGFNIPNGVNSFFDKRFDKNGVLLGVMFYEKINTSTIRELDCNGIILNSIQEVSTTDILEWQYSFKGNVKAIGNSFNKKSVSIDFNNFTVDFSKNIGKTIFFRYKLIGDVYSPLKAYTITACSPELIKPIKIKKTKCNYSSDGGLTLNFKRDLYPSEKQMVMTLYGDNNELLYQESSTSLKDNNDGTYGYTWKNKLDTGKYKLKYQTKIGSGGIDPNDGSWSSLIPADFEIGKPVPVKFSIINTSDETCFEKSNGFINIKAEGEGERTFLYQLTKEQVVQFYNGTNWVDYSGTKANDETWFPFISKNNTKIGNLAKGNYRVKVKDSKGCFVR
ncbi:hypothetical protein [Tenacibaculum ovolyticum]|uniref:hypothetical protein n=1 Tax=Tenacibaculum ovolyticum TaxID=104270 RepID=UPI001F247162|nr:hypothetical protein [Tenacibaculum ovolyticum]